MRKGLVYGLAALLAFALAGCVSQTEFNRVVKEREGAEERLRQERESFKTLVENLNVSHKKVVASLKGKLASQAEGLKAERAKSADLAKQVQGLKTSEAKAKENLGQVSNELGKVKGELAAVRKEADAAKAQLKAKDAKIAELEAKVKELEAKLEAEEEEAEPAEITE